jgi:ubiquinone/menaquinone biosynthesis C-methylase UbiE
MEELHQMNTRDNAIPIEAWNTVLFDKFTRFRFVLTEGLSDHSAELFRRHPFAPGARVLDIGCGFGDTTVAIARQVGASGAAIGLDAAENFIRLARYETVGADPGNLAFRVADVQSDDLGGPYDAAFSRFGTMFFNLPGMALRNIRRSLCPGGILTMIVWRKREDNPWIHEAEQRVREIVPVVAQRESDQVHCGPGPFSFAGADMVSDLLRTSGYQRIAFERFDGDICIGRTLDEAVAFAMALGPAGEIIRLAGDEGERRRPQVVAALREMLADYQRENGIWAGSSSWFVTARNPADRHERPPTWHEDLDA